MNQLCLGFLRCEPPVSLAWACSELCAVPSSVLVLFDLTALWAEVQGFSNNWSCQVHSCLRPDFLKAKQYEQQQQKSLLYYLQAFRTVQCTPWLLSNYLSEINMYVCVYVYMFMFKRFLLMRYSKISVSRASWVSIQIKVRVNFWLQFSSVAQSCLTLCNPMDCSTPGFPVHHQLPELTQTHVHWVRDAIQPSHPLSSPSPPVFDLSQHQDLFQWVSFSHQVVKVLEFQLQHQSFQWIFRTDFPQGWLVWSPCSPGDSQESSPTPQFKSINSSALSFLYNPTLTFIHQLAPSEDKISLLVFFFFLFPLYLNLDGDRFTLYLVLSKLPFFTGKVSGRHSEKGP